MENPTTFKEFKENILSHLKADYKVRIDSSLESFIAKERDGFYFIYNTNTATNFGEMDKDEFEERLKSLFDQGFDDFVSY